MKQGCLLSPLLFALYLNDLHEHLEGGLTINGMNIRLLLYADDIVILADEVGVLEKMIVKLEDYCTKWGMEVNTSKSEIMIFRRGGRIARNEEWKYKGQDLRIVNEYCYLGVILTPRMVFSKHLEKRNLSAKNCINSTWQSFLCKKNISLRAKWKLFMAVCRSIQAYGAQIWGYHLFEEVDKLQRYFLKKILRLPDFTPTYALMMETGIQESHLFTFDLHLRYILKTLFTHNTNRLTNQLSRLILQKQIFWAKEINQISAKYNISWNFDSLEEVLWIHQRMELLRFMREDQQQNNSERALASATRIYKDLDHSKGQFYFNENIDPYKSTWIFKARCDLIALNGNRFNSQESNICMLCNMREREDIRHFLGRCPILSEHRRVHFGKSVLLEDEILNVLNGSINNNWDNMVNYLTEAIDYRKDYSWDAIV